MTEIGEASYIEGYRKFISEYEDDFSNLPIIQGNPENLSILDPSSNFLRDDVEQV